MHDADPGRMARRKVETRSDAALVDYADKEPSAFASMLGGLIEANVKSRPEKASDFASLVAKVGIWVTDIDEGVTLDFKGGRLTVHNGLKPRRTITIRADAETVMSLADSVAGYRGQLALASDQRVNHKNGMHYDEREENRQQCEHRFLHSAQVHPDHRQHYRDTCVHPERRPLDRKKTEDRVSPAGDRDRDRQDVIDDQSASGDQAREAPEEFGRYQISAASGRKLVDCLTVRRGDYEYGQRHQQRQENREVLMRAESYECFFRAVARRAQTVGPQAHPREEGD